LYPKDLDSSRDAAGMPLSDDQRRFARRLRQQATDAETRLWYHLRGRRLEGFRFRRQHPIGPYFADFACLEVGLIVELDGGQHNTHTGVAHDTIRSDVLAARGFEILRFWNNDVLQNTQGVLDVISRRLRQRLRTLTRPAADLSRKRER
jgi:very-short-patch-repair endonuclease